MKKILAIVALIGLVSFAVTAQKKDKAPNDKKEKLKDELGITNEVAAKIKAIKADYKIKEKAIETNASLDKKAIKAKKKTLKEEREQKILALLTPAQQTKYKQLKEKNKAEEEANDD